MTARGAPEAARVWDGSNSVTNCWAGADADRGPPSSSSAAAAGREGGLGGRCLEEEMENESFFSFSIAAAAAAEAEASDPGKMRACLVEEARRVGRGRSGGSGAFFFLFFLFLKNIFYVNIFLVSQFTVLYLCRAVGN